MAVTCLQPRRPSTHTKVSATKSGKALVSEEKVKAMLRDIAFVLQCTRRLSQEIKEAKV